ncbi:hypothetical protein HWV62_34055 [Athelia sp. TMB]|nr:hypothetical protein HWV62_34055 [Athelia sp. TMB]
MAEPAPVRSNLLWFSDGNIVLQAGGTQFKVHQSILARHSAVFKDMFTVPQPIKGNEVVDGCHLVHVSDSASEFTVALEAIFLRKWVSTGEPLPIEVIAAMLRMGSKYEMEALRVEALKRLYLEFPSDLASFDRFISVDTAHSGRGSMIHRTNWFYLDAANLCRELNLLSVLPIALYWCCRWKAKVLEKGHTRADMTIATLFPVNERACFRGYPELLELKEKGTFSWLLSPPAVFDGCRTPLDCHAARSKLAIGVFFPTSTTRSLALWHDKYKAGQCGACISVARRMHHAGRQQVWDALPGVFDLPAWDELLKERAESDLDLDPFGLKAFIAMLLDPENPNYQGSSKASEAALAAEQVQESQEPPPSYAATSFAVLSPTPIDADFNADAVPSVTEGSSKQATNYVHVEINNRKIQGSYYLDPTLEIPSSLLSHKVSKTPEKDKNTCFLYSRNRFVDVDLSLVDSSSNSSGHMECKKRAKLYVGSRNGNIAVRVRRPQHTSLAEVIPFKFHAASHNGTVRLYVPNDFTGPLTLTTHNGNIKLSPAISARLASDSHNKDTRRCFIGNVSTYSEHAWNGDDVVVEGHNRTILVSTIDELESIAEGEGIEGKKLLSRIFG